MRQKLSFFIVSAALTIIPSLSLASDCSGPWQVIPGYNPGQGPPCKLLHLDSNQGTCQQGQIYETLCDDMSGGRYRTCQGPRVCIKKKEKRKKKHSNYSGNTDCRNWDYYHSRPCPPGTINADCYGDCEEILQQNNCTSWDYSRNQPCPPGTINRDCQGGCGPI